MRRLRKLIAAAVVGASAALLGVNAAHAAYANIGDACGSGVSGTACARLQFDSATNLHRTRAATDPNPGYGIVLNNAYLWHYYAPFDGGGDVFDLVRKKPGVYSSNYQVVYTDGFRKPDYESGLIFEIQYTTVNGTFYESKATGKFGSA